MRSQNEREHSSSPGCDDIIRQHKSACLRVTSLLACKELLWIGTSAGVVLTMPLPHINQNTSKITTTPIVSGKKQRNSLRELFSHKSVIKNSYWASFIYSLEIILQVIVDNFIQAHSLEI